MAAPLVRGTWGGLAGRCETLRAPASVALEDHRLTVSGASSGLDVAMQERLARPVEDARH